MKNTDKDRDTQELTKNIVDTYQDDSGINFIDVTNLPVRDKIVESLDLLIELMFPGYTGKRVVTRENVSFIVGDIIRVIEGISKKKGYKNFRFPAELWVGIVYDGYAK